MWEQMTEDIEKLGGKVLLNTRVTKLEFDGDRCVRVHAGDEVFEPSAVISSLPLRNTVGMADPQPQARGDRGRQGPALPRLPDGRGGARRRGPVPRQLDLHPRPERERRAASRTSARGAPGWSRTRRRRASGLEYFCFAGDELWETDDDKLVELGMRELEKLGLARRDAAPVRLRRARARRPTRCTTPSTPSACTIRSWLDGLDNFIQVGRNGLHRYNNSDHSMLTAHAGGGQPREGRPTTTSGRSTPSRCTTRRSARTRSSPTSRLRRRIR